MSRLIMKEKKTVGWAVWKNQSAKQKCVNMPQTSAASGQ